MIYNGNYYSTTQLLAAHREGKKVVLLYPTSNAVEIRCETLEIAQDLMDKICLAAEN